MQPSPRVCLRWYRDVLALTQHDSLAVYSKAGRKCWRESSFCFQAIMWWWDGWAGFPVSNKPHLSHTHIGSTTVTLYTQSQPGCKNKDNSAASWSLLPTALDPQTVASTDYKRMEESCNCAFTNQCICNTHREKEGKTCSEDQRRRKPRLSLLLCLLTFWATVNSVQECPPRRLTEQTAIRELWLDLLICQLWTLC